MTAAAGPLLILFAKAPVEGQAKTRLIPALGAAGAAALAERLLQHATSSAVAAELGEVEICATPDTHHPAFQALAQTYSLRLSTQGEGDLGKRMNRALSRGLEQSSAVMLMGTDIPALDAALLRQAAQALAEHDAVFIPTHDGGYALVGLRQPAPRLFSDMAWSTPTVMAATRERARAAGLRWAELPAVADIDLPADLVHLPADWLP